MKKLTFIILIITTVLFACKNSSQAMDSAKIEPSNQKTSTSQNANDIIYDMIIAFGSIGTGIDYEAKKKIDKIVESFNKDNNTSISPEKVNSGREGEVDYNFTLKNLSTSQKEAFTALIEEATGSSERVHLSFNKKSVHKR